MKVPKVLAQHFILVCHMNHKILICDDDQGILEVMKIMLETSGYEVMVVSNGKAIIKKVKEFQPEVIYLDIWMPGIDGREVIKLLRRDPVTAKVPIVMMSALSDTEDIAKIAGVENHLSKPFEMDYLISLTGSFFK